MSPQLQIPVPCVPGCSPIPGHWEEMEQEYPIGKDLEPSSRNPWRSQVAHVKPGFLSLPFNILDLNNKKYPGSHTGPPNLHQFSPLCLPLCVSCSGAPLQSEIFFRIPQDAPSLPSDAAFIPAPKSLLTPTLTHNSQAFAQKACISPSVLGVWPSPSVWTLQEPEHKPPPSG